MSAPRAYEIGGFYDSANDREDLLLPHMVDIYIDDSDTINRGGIVCLACVAAPRVVWNHFANVWAAIGRRHKFPRLALHTSDFLSGRGDYALLNLDDAKRQEILLEYFDVIHRLIPMVICVSVESDALAVILKVGKVRVASHVFCLLKVFQLLHNNVRTFIQTDDYTVSTCCDFGDSSPHMLGAFRNLRKHVKGLDQAFTAFGFADDKTYQPLQLADLFACLAVREIRRIGTPQTYFYGSMDHLINASKPSNSVFNINQVHLYKPYLDANADSIRREMEQIYL